MAEAKDGCPAFWVNINFLVELEESAPEANRDKSAPPLWQCHVVVGITWGCHPPDTVVFECRNTTYVPYRSPIKRAYQDPVWLLLAPTAAALFIVILKTAAVAGA